MHSHVVTLPEIEFHIVGIRVPDAVLANPFSESSVATPTNRPGDHVVPGGVMHPTVRPRTCIGAVHLRKDSVVDCDQLAGGEIQPRCSQLGLFRSEAVSHYAKLSCIRLAVNRASRSRFVSWSKISVMALERNPPVTTKPPFALAERLGFIQLHLDDLDDLMRLLRSRSGAVVLAAKNAVADEAEDLRGATSEELASVALRVSDPDMTIWLQRGRARVETSDDSDAAQSLVADTAALLRTRPARFGSAWFASLFAASPLVILTTVALIVPVLSNPSRTDLFWPVSLILVGVLAFAIWLGTSNWSLARKAGSAKIIPRFRSEIRANSGNRQLVWATILAAFFGSVITGLVAFMLR